MNGSLVDSPRSVSGSLAADPVAFERAHDIIHILPCIAQVPAWLDDDAVQAIVELKILEASA
jgi:hypothetical protein